MQETFKLEDTLAERAELESVAAGFARTPRLEQLLRYLAEKYFEGESDQLTEYNIATEFFGRKKTEFISSQDSIARVETHRLRKKLAAFYEHQGRNHTIQISIPLGSYVPTFIERGPSERDAYASVPRSRSSDSDTFNLNVAASETPAKAPAEVVGSSTERSRTGRHILIPLPGARTVTLAFLIIAIIAAGFFWRRNFQDGVSLPNSDRPTVRASSQDGRVDQVAASGSTSSAELPLRMIAGYSGAPQKDNNGDIWQSDHYFHQGWARREPRVFVARTGDPVIFRYGRDGDFSYDIPLAPGEYELHLYFMQTSDAAQSEDTENKAIFNVAINGVLTLHGFDIVADSMGRNTADERVFRDVAPASDGFLHLRFSTVLGTPSLSAIQILKGTPHQQLPTRIVMQPDSYTDRNGQLWRPDNYFLSGRYLSHNVPNSNPDLLPFERFGHFEYAIPADTRDRYTVVLYFEELYFGSPEVNLPDERLFRVICDGQTILDDFDIMREVGPFHLLKKTFYHVKPTAQGKIDLDFEPISNYATVSAIEVLDENN